MHYLAILGGLVLLIWSADRFVTGASMAAHHLGVAPLVIGLVIVGFGTSAPEMLVSVTAAMDGSPELALGNAIGSDIVNIALILGLAALISPIAVQSQILRRELPLLIIATGCVGWQLMDGRLSRTEGLIDLALFGAVIGWSVWLGIREKGDSLDIDVSQEIEIRSMTLPWACVWVAIGLIGLIVSSRLLVWGAVILAKSIGISDLVVGLTIVAIGTSLPELASTVVAARKGEHDLAVGNIIGSNLFNTLAVVGLAASIKPFPVAAGVLARDYSVLIVLTVLLFIFGIGMKGTSGRINRLEGAAFLVIYAGYTAWLLISL